MSLKCISDKNSYVGNVKLFLFPRVYKFDWMKCSLSIIFSYENSWNQKKTFELLLLRNMIYKQISGQCSEKLQNNIVFSEIVTSVSKTNLQ